MDHHEIYSLTISLFTLHAAKQKRKRDAMHFQKILFKIRFSVNNPTLT